MALPCQRDRFDLPDVTYLNCCYMSPQMKAATEAGQEAVTRKARPWEVAPVDFFTESEALRGAYAELSGAAAADVALIPSASYGLALAAKNLPLSPGQQVLVLANQFPSNVYVWQERCREVGAELRFLEANSGQTLSECVLDTIGANTGIVALPNVHWSDGRWLDLVAIAARCREVGAALVLDLTQSLGAAPFSVQEVQPDFMISAGYKWLCGPYTLGMLYAAPQWQDGSPLEHNWIARKQSEDFRNLVNYQDDFQSGARRYDMGERSNFVLVPMALVAARQLLEWTVPEITETLRELTSVVAEFGREFGLEVLPEVERAPHFLGLRNPNGWSHDLGTALVERKVFVSFRGEWMRVSPHLYNTPEDVERLFAELRNLRDT
jgi:selenocysteine lyase/cysteine desulfurase